MENVLSDIYLPEAKPSAGNKPIMQNHTSDIKPFIVACSALEISS